MLNLKVSQLESLKQYGTYQDKFRSSLPDQANLFNEFFFEQFSGMSDYGTEIDIDGNDRMFNSRFHELDIIQLLLKDINPSKTAGHDGIHGMVLKNCAASLLISEAINCYF